MKRSFHIPVGGILVITTFVWAMVNSVEVAGSVIILLHRDGYSAATLVVDRLYWSHDYETGLTWGLEGRIDGSEARLLAPQLGDGEDLGLRRLQKMYPTGTEVRVWHNPEVTQTFFQRRTLDVIVYSPDLAELELGIVYRWMKMCGLPFVGALLIAIVLQRRNRRSTRPPDAASSAG